MVEIDMISLISQTGFPIAVAVFLLWKGYTQDKEYLSALQKMNLLLERHIEQKDAAIELLREELRQRRGG